MEEEKYIRDVEEADGVLESNEGNPVNFWESKQKELLTSVVDYNLGTLFDLVDRGMIDLSPQYQRRYRWDSIRQSTLIESFLMNVPVPPIFLNEDAYGKYSVIDGKQRLNTIYQFLGGKLKLSGVQIFKDINSKYFDDLPLDLQTVFKTRPVLRAIIILRQSDKDVKNEVFQRLNSGGVRVNPQEIRNNAYTGVLNDLIMSLSVNKDFHRLLGIKAPEKSAIYKEMRDAEFVLRFFTFRTSWQSFSGGMRRQMDDFMESNGKKISSKELKKLESEFLQTIKTVHACFGKHAFQRWSPDGPTWRQQVLAALYDAEMFACRDLNPIISVDSEQQAKILEGLKALFTNDDFRKSVDAATNTPAFFRYRIEAVRKLLQSVLGEVYA